ncbi:MAG: PQQ-like beta-propeller repeat protein [Gammaproteobacteria bacterium]|nr:PQQ-like beta-propeller repeat protein [Gammaproteobacteria bacterium]MBV9696557.1 PQQ-like beta-propeller repeat protein [Gammaproteobacteria bacterium]
MRLIPAVALLLTPVAFAAPDQFRGDAAHTGIYDAAGAPQLHGVRWSFRAGGAIASSPVYGAGLVYFGSNDHKIYALDAKTGKERWQYATKGRVSSSPAFGLGRVYVASYDGNLYALDAAHGTLAWKFATEGERRFSARHLHGMEPAGELMPDPFDLFLSSPALSADTVYFGSGDGNVYALDARSGTLRWKFHTGNVVHASPAVAQGMVYVGSWDSYFYALDAATGAERWRFKTGEDPAIGNQVGIQSSAVVADGIVYFGCRDSNLYALDARSGAQRWEYSNKGSWVISSPAVQDGRVYFATSDTGLLHALDARSGAPLFELAFNHWPFFSSPALARGFLYIGSQSGTLLAVDVKRAAVAWTFRTEGAEHNAARYTQADGSPDYKAAFSDSFYDDGVIGVARMRSVGAVDSSPLIESDTVYVGSWDGQLYAIG